MITAISDTRPNRITDTKDEAYHQRWGRYGVGAWFNDAVHQQWLHKTMRNEAFFQGKTWTQEDLDFFFRDENNNERNRIAIGVNIMRPMVNQYKGNADSMTIGATARSISPLSTQRKEKSLADQLFYTDVASRAPEYRERLSQTRGIGKDKAETVSIHENLYVDKYTRAINRLMYYSSSLNRFPDKQAVIAEQIATSGLGAMFDFEHAGHLRFDVVQSKDFFWDRNAREWDLSDGSGWGHWQYWSPTQVFEVAPQLSQEQKVAIENWDKRTPPNSIAQADLSGTRTGIPVANVYWRDTEPMEYGYVVNEYGDTVFVRINFATDGNKPKYTDSDLVAPPQTPEAMRLVGKKMKTKIYPDVIRYVKFIPWEAVASNSKEKFPDVVLQWGLMPYQETNFEDYNSVVPPYKVSTWAYLNGQVDAPLDDVADPQRLLNRFISVTEGQASNSGGAGPIFDSSAFTSKDEESEAASNMYNGKPVFANMKGRGVQNMVSNYDLTMKAGTYGMFNAIEAIRNLIQVSTGLNDPMQGQGTGPKQLVGVTELMIQRGSLVQQPFYNAIARIFLGCYQAVATRGKRIYIENRRKLLVAIGDEDAEVLELSRDMLMEDFRVFVKRDNPHEALISAGSQQLMFLLEMGLIDRKLFSSLYGRATPEDVTAALRQHAANMEEIARRQQKQQEEQQQEQGEAIQQMMSEQREEQRRQEARDDLAMDRKHVFKMEEATNKAASNAAYRAPTKV